MTIRLDRDQLALTLDEAIALARSSDPLPEVWIRRVQRIGESGLKTYVAALGGALLAKATDPEVDSLTREPAGGPHGYSLRTAAELLTSHNHGRFHMGATGKNPLNNRPFLGGPSRIDEFTAIKPNARPTYEAFRDALYELNRMGRGDALLAFAAWLRVRMAVQQSEDRDRLEAISVESGISLARLLDIAQRFLVEDPEDGRRGQAFVAAVADCAFGEVRLQAINDPKPGDVRILRAGRLVLPVEVKQVTVDARTASELTEEALGLGVDLAVLVVLARDHRPLDRDGVRRRAAQRGVLLEVAETTAEIVSSFAVYSGTPAAEFKARLPGAYATRMREHGVSRGAQEYWRNALSGE